MVGCGLGVRVGSCGCESWLGRWRVRSGVRVGLDGRVVRSGESVGSDGGVVRLGVRVGLDGGVCVRARGLARVVEWCARV